jgi:hypothetical protein
MNIFRFLGGLIAIVLGALMVADGVIEWVNNTVVFFPGVDFMFKIAIGIIVIVLAASVLDLSRK